MKNFSRSVLGAAIASVLAAPGVVWAQSADASLRGTAPANADVTARNVATGVTRRAKANCLPFYWGRRQFTARDVEQFERQVEQSLWGQAALPDDSAQRHRRRVHLPQALSFGFAASKTS